MNDRLANYEPVQTRLARFWADHPNGRIHCEPVERDTEHVLMVAHVWRDTTDLDPAVNGYANEVHDGSPVNRQGWMLENAETSAIGRALANLGYAPTAARPTREDMERTIGPDAYEMTQHTKALDPQVTFKRLTTLQPDTQAALRKLANETGHKLTLKQLHDDPAWHAQVIETINAWE